MNYREAIDYLSSYTDYEKVGMPHDPALYDLRRVGELLARLGNPHLKAKSIQITGANGKGSVATMIASALTASGHTTGLYTSPHLRTWRERIRINDKLIPEEDLASLVEKYVEDFKIEREKFDNRRKKEEARRLNDMAVKNFYVGKVELAIRQLKEAVLLDDTAPEVLANLAAALSKDGKQKDARKIYEKILEEKPDMVEAQVGMGLILFERGNIDEAIEIFKEASKKDDLEAITYANLGYAYERKESIDKAVSNWEKAFELDPTLKDVGEKLKLYKDKEA